MREKDSSQAQSPGIASGSCMLLVVGTTWMQGKEVAGSGAAVVLFVSPETR